MVAYNFQEMFPLSEDDTEYRLLTDEHLSITSLDGREGLKIEPQGLTLLAEQAFLDTSHLYRASHLQLLANIFKCGAT